MRSASTLREFLHTRRVEKGGNITGMGGSDIGCYDIPDADYDTFLDLYHKHVFTACRPSSLLEKHGDFTPLLVDLDFRYAADTKERPFNKSSITRFIGQYAAAFYHFFEYSEPLRFFVMLRPELTAEKGVVKDGLHIVVGDLTLDYKIPFTLRRYLLDKGIVGVFPDLVNSPEDCFDESVIRRNNWFLYGATKPARDAYLVDYCFSVGADGVISEVEWAENDRELIRLFSLRSGRSEATVLSVRASVKDEWATWESIACPAAPRTKEKKSIVRDTTSICSSRISCDISKLLKTPTTEWAITECDGGYKLVHDTNTCLVADGVEHSTPGHSCIFVKKGVATVSCFSHNNRRLPRTKGDALWRLLSGEGEADYSEIYAEKRVEFERKNFRVLNPPGYMTLIDDTWVHYTRQQLIDMNSGIFLDDGRRERFVDWWLRDEEIRTYSRVGYYVDVAECPATVFNTFRGFAGGREERVSGCDISLILQHFREIVAGGDVDVYEFIMDWMAACIQSPRNLNGICLVIMGAHGSGKDILFNWFGSKVIGMGAYFKTARPHIDMFGAFNSSRVNRVLYHIEEGNRNSFTAECLEQFKNSITDEFAAIQLKGKDTRDNVINYNHFVITTNNSVPFDIHGGERRFFAVRASGDKVRNNEYFGALVECMRAPGAVREFYDILVERDLTARDWRNPPATSALVDWKHSCESEVVQFIEYFREAKPELKEIKSSELYAEYRWYCKEFKYTALTLRMFAGEVKKILGEPRHGKTGNLYMLT
jgi:hypothetical protein